MNWKNNKSKHLELCISWLEITIFIVAWKLKGKKKKGRKETLQAETKSSGVFFCFVRIRWARVSFGVEGSESLFLWVQSAIIDNFEKALC